MSPSSQRPGLVSVRPANAQRLQNWADAHDAAVDVFARNTSDIANGTLARRTGKDESTFRGMKSGRLNPSLGAVMTLPRDAAARVLRECLELVEGDAPVVPVESTQRRLAHAVGVLALEVEVALADGRIDDNEREQLQRQLLDIGTMASRGAVGVRRVG